MDLKKTLLLPDPDATIPMKADLSRLEPRIQSEWEARNVYREILESREGADTYILHDGPPYTNNFIHMGTALNKILKDFVIKSRTMMGFRCPYVPGYDNHGLPIEQAVTKKLKDAKVAFDDDAVRKEARNHARHFADEQTAQFRRLGVLGQWDRPYFTMDPKQEGAIVRVFKGLVEKGLVYRGLKPTQWSPTLQTALADTEIVYKDHVSRAIFVAFPLDRDPENVLGGLENVATVIWTTTPWTIPANLAVAFGDPIDYVAFRSETQDRTFLVAEARLEALKTSANLGEGEVVGRYKGAQLESLVFRHPLMDRDSRAVLAEYVTTEDGTGVVHTAPSHGREDFLTGQKYGLPVPNTVDARGVLTEEAGPFAGTHYIACDEVVTGALREAGALLAESEFRHQYPYGERDEAPVIFRATEQWFVDVQRLKPRMLEEIAGVTWTPATGRNRIEPMVAGRPDWCVSRQRPWGVGIPVFYGRESGVPILDPEAIEKVAQLVERGGSDAWFTATPEEILGPNYKHPETGETEFTKETDTLDVWFDSGATSLVVLGLAGEGRPLYPEWSDLRAPADLYLEGSDQHRGWFNTSLILSTALKDRAPYRAVLTHGFITDDKGRKMSKRLGNVIDPVKAAETHGADVLRLWSATINYSDDVPCSDLILKQAGESYRTFRNTLRFLLGNAEFGLDESYEEGLQAELDRWLLARLEVVTRDYRESFENFRFAEAMRTLADFCRDDLSRFYLDAIKDRMYCEPASSPLRRSGARTCALVLERLTLLLAPVIPHTAEETWWKMGRTGTVLAQRWPEPSERPIPPHIDALKALRENVLAAFEAFKGADDVKDSQDAILMLDPLPEGGDVNDLATFLKVSWVEKGPHLTFRRTTYAQCQRSRLRRPDVEEILWEGEPTALTLRDRRALGLA